MARLCQRVSLLNGELSSKFINTGKLEELLVQLANLR